jgi:UDP-glucuronate decarboxylase
LSRSVFGIFFCTFGRVKPNVKSEVVKSILVTGGAGFIGSHVCERLVGNGLDVICLDNFITKSKRNINHLLGNRYFELVRHDILNPFFAEPNEKYNLAVPPLPCIIKEPDQDHQNLGYGLDQFIGIGEAHQFENIAGIDE